MEKKLTKVGSSYGVILDKAILELIGANEKTKFKVEIKGKSVLLTPIND